MLENLHLLRQKSKLDVYIQLYSCEGMQKSAGVIDFNKYSTSHKAGFIKYLQNNYKS